MKKKSDGTHRARLNAGGFEQDDGFLYTKDYVLAPVVNDITIRIVFTLMIMDAWWSELWDGKRAFLTVIFNKGEGLYLELTQGMEKYHPVNILLLLLRTLYGLIKAAAQFWKELLENLGL